MVENGVVRKTQFFSKNVHKTGLNTCKIEAKSNFTSCT